MKDTAKTSISTCVSALSSLGSRSRWILSRNPPKETDVPVNSFGFLFSPQRFDSMKYPWIGRGDEECVNAVYWQGDISKELSSAWKDATVPVTEM